MTSISVGVIQRISLRSSKFVSLVCLTVYDNHSLYLPQVDFGSLRKVTRVATQGSGSFFVKNFQLKYSNNSIEWLDYRESGIIKVRMIGNL